jgi:hypothetical protein
MLGALEVKAITRLARERGAEWKPIHTAVMGCLLAHHNRRSGHCWPRRKDIAEHCNVCERTIDRAIARLTAWGAIERMQPKAASSQQFRPAQYVFRFVLPPGNPQDVQKPCELVDKNCAYLPEPCDKNGGSRATKTGGAVRHLGVARNKEVRERSKGKDLRERAQSENPPSQFQNSQISQSRQKDFLERDLRKMAEAWKYLTTRDAGGACRASGLSNRQMFEAVCDLAGITIERGLELEELKKKWPARGVPDWLKEAV